MYGNRELENRAGVISGDLSAVKTIKSAVKIAIDVLSCYEISESVMRRSARNNVVVYKG